MKYHLRIVRDRDAWKVGHDESWDGPYATLAEAIDIALHSASMLHKAGHSARVSVPHRGGRIELTLTVPSRSAA